MKNKLLSLGSLAIVGASAFVVVACGEEDKKKVVEINLETEANKISEKFDTVDVADKSGNDFTSDEINTDVLDKFKEITEYKANNYGMYYALTEALSEGVKIKKAAVKTKYDTGTKELVLTLTIGAEGKDDVTKDMTIKFGTTNLSTEVAKINGTVAITKSADSAASNKDFSTLAVSAVNDVKNDFKGIDQIYSGSAFTSGSGKLLSSALSSSVSIDKMLVKQKYASKKMVVTIHLAKSGVVAQRATSMKDVEFSFGGIDASDELAKLRSEITGVNNSQMASWSSLSKDANAKSVYDNIGNSRFASGQSSLGSGYDYEVKIKTQLSSRKVVVTIKLTKSGESNGLEVESATKDVTITFAAA